MDEYIKKTDAIIAIRNLYPDMPRINFNGSKVKWWETYDSFIKCENEIRRIPPENLAPIRHGKWSCVEIYEYKLADRSTIYEPVFSCSACGIHTESYVRGDYPNMPEDADFPRYCPNCGAIMDL